MNAEAIRLIYTFKSNIARYGKYRNRSKDYEKSLTRTLRMNFEINLAGRSKESPKQFWSYVKSKLNTRTNIPTLIKLNGSEARTSKEKAESLNEYSGNVYKEESNDLPPVANHPSVPLVNKYNRCNGVMLIARLESTGPDGWHPYFLSSLADILSTSLEILFNKSLCEGIVPIQWVEACITAIHKKGLKSVIGNYRPVSITSVICKMMESIIRDYVIDYMVSNNYIYICRRYKIISKN